MLQTRLYFRLALPALLVSAAVVLVQMVGDALDRPGRVVTAGEARSCGMLVPEALCEQSGPVFTSAR